MRKGDSKIKRLVNSSLDYIKDLSFLPINKEDDKLVEDLVKRRISKEPTKPLTKRV